MGLISRVSSRTYRDLIRIFLKKMTKNKISDEKQLFIHKLDALIKELENDNNNSFNNNNHNNNIQNSPSSTQNNNKRPIPIPHPSLTNISNFPDLTINKIDFKQELSEIFKNRNNEIQKIEKIKSLKLDKSNNELKDNISILQRFAAQEKADKAWEMESEATYQFLKLGKFMGEIKDIQEKENLFLDGQNGINGFGVQ